MPRKHTPKAPTAWQLGDVNDPDARKVAGTVWRPCEESGETWLSRWAPYRSDRQSPPPGDGTPVAEDLPEHERAADGDSETLTRLRARVHQDYARRQHYGPLGRSL